MRSFCAPVVLQLTACLPELLPAPKQLVPVPFPVLAMSPVQFPAGPQAWQLKAGLKAQRWMAQEPQWAQPTAWRLESVLESVLV